MTPTGCRQPGMRMNQSRAISAAMIHPTLMEGASSPPV